MNDSELEAKLSRNREERLRQIRQWAEYVRTHPDEDWGRQVNVIVDSQLQSARHHANAGAEAVRTDARPDPEHRGAASDVEE